MLRILAILVLALWAPLPLAACEGEGGMRSDVVLDQGSSCCDTDSCCCTRDHVPVCNHQQFLSDEACICGCAEGVPLQKDPFPAALPVRVEYAKALLQVEKPMHGFGEFRVPLDTSRREEAGSFTGVPLFLINLSLRT